MRFTPRKTEHNKATSIVWIKNASKKDAGSLIMEFRQIVVKELNIFNESLELHYG